MMARTGSSSGSGNPQPFVIEAADGQGGVATQTFTLNIRGPHNQPPRITSSPVGPAIVGEAWTYTPTATDPENDVLTIEFTETSAFGAIWNNGEVTWIAANEGDVLTGDVEVTDTAGNTATQTIAIPASDAPTNDPGNQRPNFVTAPEGGAIVGQEWTYFAHANRTTQLE